MPLTDLERQQAQESLKRLETLLANKNEKTTSAQVDYWTRGAAKLRGELGMADPQSMAPTKEEVIGLIKEARGKGLTDKGAILSYVKSYLTAGKSLKFDVPQDTRAQEVSRPTGNSIQSSPTPPQRPKKFAMPPEALAMEQAAAQPGIPPGARVIRGGPAGGQIIMPPAPAKPTYEGAQVPESLKQIPGAAPAQSETFQAPLGRFAAPGEAVPNLPSGAPAAGPPEITLQSPNLLSDLVDNMISPGRMGTGELDLRPLALTLNSIILGAAGRGISAQTMEGVLADPTFQNVVKSSPLAQKIMGFALQNERITRAASAIGETAASASPFMLKDMLDAPDVQTGFKDSLQTLAGFFTFDLAMRGAFTGLSRVYRDFAPYSALKPIQRAAEERAMDIIDTAQVNAAKRGSALSPDERGAVLRYAAHAAASRIDEMVSPEFADAYRNQLRMHLRDLMQQAEQSGESPNTMFEVLQTILDANARNMNSAVQDSIRILTDAGLTKDMQVAATDLKKALGEGIDQARGSRARPAAQVVSARAKAAGKTVSAEGTLMPGGKPFVHAPGASAEEIATMQAAEETAHRQLKENKTLLPGAQQAQRVQESIAAEKPAPPKDVSPVVTADTVMTPEKEVAVAQEQAAPVTARQRAQQVADDILSGKKPKRARPVETPTAPAPVPSPAKTDRLTLLKQRAAAIKGERKVAVREAMEQAMVEEAKPTAGELKPEEELFAEILDDQRSRVVIDPLHSRALRDFTVAQPKTGPAVTYGGVRVLADNLGYDLRAQRAADGATMEYTLTPRTDMPHATEQPVRTSSLSDMMAELQRKSGAFLSGEVANQTLLADSPDDEEDVRKTKTMLRTAIRAGTMGVLLGSVVPRNSFRLFADKAAQTARSILTGLPNDAGNSGIWRRQAAELERVSNDISHLWFSLRNPKEIIRNWPEELKAPMFEVDSAVRAMGKELDTWEHMLGTEAPRAGIGEKSDASRWAYDIMEGIDSDVAAKITNPRSKAAWHRAIAETFNRRPDEMAEATLRAVDAVDAMPERLLSWPKDFIDGLRDLRKRSKENFVEKFRTGEGAENPFLVLDDKGNAIRRVNTSTKAQQVVDRAAKKGKTGWTYKQGVDPTPGEIEDRIGRTVSNYVTRLTHGLLEHDMRVEELVKDAPWASPVVMLDEMKRMLRIGNKVDRRAAFEGAFGVMDDETYRDLVKTALKATQSGGSVTGFKGAATIPEEIYVRFYRNRTKSYDYERDAVKAMRTYSRSVLRDLYLDKHLPAFDKSVDAMVAQVQAGKLSPAAVMQVINYAEDVFKKNRSGQLPFAQTVGTLTNAMHGALLWARGKPAINNFVGQVFLVGIPQELGEGYGDVMTTASVAMWSPSVRRLLQQHDLIREAMPRGYRQFSEIIDDFSKAETMRQRGGAAKDMVKKALDFITTYTEVPIRTQSFLFGFLKYLKDNKALLQQIPGLGMNPATKASLDDILKATLAHRNMIPDDVWHGALRSGEEWVGRNAFFFEHESQPALLRAAKRIPVAGQPLTFLSNFPMTYMNRYTSTLLDAFGRNIPGATRRKAMGTILTHFGITMMLAGPAGFPLYSAFLENAAPEDPELPGKARRFLAPYAQFFSTIFGHDLVSKIPGVGPAWERRDLTTYGSTQPFTEFFNPRRYTDATLFRPFVDGWKAFSPFADPGESEEARLRAFGWFAPLMTDAPPPTQNLVPEAATTFMPGGTALNDVLNIPAVQTFLGLASNASMPGPLDQRGKLKSTTNPLERFVFGPTAEDREQRARVQTTMRARSEDERRARRFVDALVNPRLLGTAAGRSEMKNAMQLVRERPQVLDSVLSGDRIQAAIRDMRQTPDVRAYFNLPRPTLERLVLGTKQFPKGISVLLDGLDKLPPEEQERRRRKYAAIMMAYVGGEAPPAQGQ